jgi:hypothetical protein
MTVLVPAAARVGNVCPHALVRSTAAHVAENDLGTLFKLILMVASPETVLMRLPKAAGRYYDFGVTETRMIGPRRCLARQTGVPRQVIDWIVDGTLGWIPLVMGRAGAREVEVLPLEPVRDGEQYGVETVSMAFEIGWQE